MSDYFKKRMEELGLSSKSSTSTSSDNKKKGSYFADRYRELGLDRDKSGREVDSDYISSFMRDADSYFGSAESDYGMMKDHVTSESIYNKRKKTADDLSQRGFAIKSYLDKNRDKLDEKSYAELSNYLDDFGIKSAQVGYSFYSANRSYTQNNPEYRLKRYEDTKSQIADIESRMESAYGGDYKKLKNKKEELELSARQYERGLYKADSYHDIYKADDFDEVSSKRDFTMPSRESSKEDDIRMDSSTWYYDANGRLYNAFGEEVTEGDIYTIVDGTYKLKSKSDDVDRLGIFLSAGEAEYRDAVGQDGAWEDIINDGLHGDWNELTDEEVSAYYYILNKEGYEAADKYLEDMTPELNRRAVAKTNENLTAVFDDANPLEKLALSGMSVIARPIGNIAAGIEDAVNIVTGNDINPYSMAHRPGNLSNQIREEQAKEFDELTGGAKLPMLDYSLGDTYQAVMSYADMMTSLFTGAGAYATQMGAGAFSDTASDLYQQGASMGEIGSLGAIAGIAEGFFENVSIDRLIKIGDVKTLGQLLKNIAIQGGIEASEEMATEATNIIADAIIRGGTSNWSKLLEESGGNVLTALGKEIRQIGKAGLSGFIAGTLGGGTSSAGSYISNDIHVRQEGQNILENKGYDDLKALAESMSAEASGIKSLDRAVAKAETKTTARNVGKLSAKVESVRTQQNVADVQKALTEEGMSESRAKKVAKTIVEIAEKKSSGMELTQEEYDTVTRDKATYAAYSSLISDPDSSVNSRNDRIANARVGITKNEDGSVSYSDSLTSRITDGVVHKAAYENIGSQNRFRANVGVSEEVAETEDADFVPMTAEEAAMYKGKTTVYDVETDSHKAVEITGIASIKDGEMILKLDNGETANASDVRFASEGEALVYSTVLDMGVNAGTAEALVGAFKGSNVSAGKYALGIKDAYSFGKMNIPLSQLSRNSFAHSLTKGQQDLAYKLGKNDAKVETKARQAAIDEKVATAKGKAKAKVGSVIIEDSVTTTENGEIDESVLTPMQKASLEGVKALAQLSPINFHVFASKKVNGKFVATINGEEIEGSPNGVYYAGTNDIWIDLNAGDMGEGTMLWTAAHEISHYIRERSPAKWKAMADFAIGELSKKQGVSVHDMLENQKAKVMARADADTKTDSQITDEAYEELVSDALTDMLTDGTVIEALANLKQQDKGLWQTIKDAVANLLKRWGEILGVYEGRTLDTAEARALEGMDKAYKKLQKMYAEAFAEANAVEEAEAYLKENGIDVVKDGEQEAASLNSVRNLLNETERQKVAKAIATRFDVTVEEATEWLKAETSMASLILNPKYSQYLDYEADDSETAIKQNADYPQGTVDFSNICKKRRAFTEVMNRVLRNFPDHVFLATDLARIRTIMSEEKMEVACAICYVEDRRQLDSIVGQNFLDSLELYRNGSKTRPDGKPFNAQQIKAMKLIEGDTYTPSIYELVTLEGRNALKAKNPNMEEAWVTFNNARGMQAVRLLTNEAEYKRQILKYNKKTVKSKNDVGGLRIYSFSDMEMFHLIDIIQVITDSAAVGLKIQGYTKVNEYAKAVKDTGEKLNRSLIPAGDLGYHIEDGKVVLDYDTVEGIDINHPDFFDSTDNPDVGNIVIGINETQIRAAMVSEFIDYIIPFHTGQSKEVLGEKGIAEWHNYEDSQSERDLSTGKKSEHQINIYTEVIEAAEKEGKPIKNKVDFVNKFLEVCKENGLKPRFSEFLNIGENGDYVYTEGYHKFLVDFKTFDPKTGEYLPQMPVKPKFDDGYITGLLEDYAKGQKAKDEELAKSMPKVIDRITKEIVKPTAKWSGRNNKKPSYNEWDVQSALYDALDHEDKGDDHLIKVGTMPNYIAEKLGISGDFYIYRNHIYENMVSEDQAKEDGRYVEGRHYHDLGFDITEAAIMSLENPILSIATQSKKNNPAVAMILPVKGKNGIPLYSVMSFYSSMSVNGDFSTKPHVVLSIYETDMVKESNDEAKKSRNKSLEEIVEQAVKDGKVIDFDKKMRDTLSVIAERTRLGDITETSLANSLAQFRKEIKTFKEKNKISYSERNTDSNRSLLANALETTVQNEVEANKLREYKEKIALIDAEQQKLAEINAQIKEISFSKGKRDTEKLKSLRFEAAQAANRINTFDRQLLNLESTKVLKRVLEREKGLARKRQKQQNAEVLKDYRDRYEAKLREQRQKNAESRKKAADRRKASAIKEKIKNFKAKLESSLLSPTDRVYVPVNLINAMIDVCGLIDTDTELYKADGSINKAQEKRNATKERLQALKDEYEALKDNTDPTYSGEYDEVIYKYLTKLLNDFGNKSLADMTLEELTSMYEILKSIDGTLQDARKLIGRADAKTIYEAADSIVAEQARITKKRKKGKRNKVQKARDSVIDLSLSPVRNVERMSGYNSDSELVRLFHDFEKGVRRKNMFVMQAYKAFEALTTGKNSKAYEDAIYKEFGGKKYVDVNGRKFGISKMQMMQTILSYEREVANKMTHIENSGFSFADMDMLRKGKLKEAVSEEYSHRIPNAISMVESFRDALASDKWAQEYMEAARKFFNGTAKDAINETYLTLKHRILARDKSYIPFEVDKNFVVREISAQNDIQQTINSYGMLQETKKGASQPLIITGLNNILDRHIDQVGNVQGLAIPIRNFNKVWNVRAVESDFGDPSVQAAIQRNWGLGGTKHITQTVQDLQGARVNTQSDIYRKIKSGYIGATFALNLSVVTKQIGSLYSASSMLNWRDPIRSLFNLVGTMVNHKKIAAEVDKYTATAWMRRQGLSDAELHTLVTESKKPGLLKLFSKINPAKLITAMDSAVALSLWKYAKQDTAKRTGLKGEELLKATAEFYDSVIENTQSMTDVLHRPEIQKRSDVVSEAFGMFKTDLYQMAGQLQVTLGRYSANKTKENGKALGRTVYAVLGSAIWGSLMTTLFALLRYKVNPYRDDEDKDLEAESWIERQLYGLGGDVVGYFLPLFGGELVGIVENIRYGESEEIVDSLALTAINDLYESMVTVGAAFKDGEIPSAEQYKKLVVKALQAFGIPANNAVRFADAIRLHAKDFANGEFLSFEAGAKRTAAEHMHGIVEDLNAGKDVRKRFDKAFADKGASALKTALGNMYKDGEVDEATAKRILDEYFDIDADDIHWQLDKWDYTAENGSDEDYSRYDDFLTAVETGSGLKNTIKVYLDNGVTADTLARQITTHFKPIYKAMSTSERARLKGYLLNAYELLGKKRSDKSKDIDKWLKDD